MPTDADLNHQSDAIYERFGRPLEAAHWGEFVAIMPDGRHVIGVDSHAVALEAFEKFGRGAFLYKVGPVAIGRMPRLRLVK